MSPNIHHYPLIRATIALAVGILSARQSPEISTFFLFCLIFLPLLGYLACTVWIRISLLQGVLFYFLFISIGFSSWQLSADINQSNHFSKVSNGRIEAYLVMVEDFPSIKETGLRFKGSIFQLKDSTGWTYCSGNISIFLADTLCRLQPGDQLIIRSFPKEVNPPKNPGEFDYRAYLASQNIFFQDYVKPLNYKQYGEVIMPVMDYAGRTRSYIIEIFDQHLTGSPASALAKAMLIGQKDDLDTDLRRKFSDTGVMHILAVSGLHVGILLVIVMHVFGFLRNLKGGGWLFALICIAFLWFYAWVTGLSPSVMRAATMFSLVAIGKAWRKQTNVLNTVAASAFLLLLFDPNLLFQLGFQLSYSAVFAILLWYPFLYQCWVPRWRWLDKIWQLACVSIAAQLGTLPITVYYFHQFPTWFLFSNLVAVPMASILLITSLTMVAVSFNGFLIAAVAWVLQFMSAFLTNFLSYMSLLPFHIWDGIFISYLEYILLILMLVFAMIILIGKKPAYIFLMIFTIGAFSTSRVWSNIQIREQKQWVLYAGKELVVDYFHNGHLATNKLGAVSYSIKGYRDKMVAGQSLQISSSIQNEWELVEIGGKKILITAADKIINIPPEIDFLVIKHPNPVLSSSLFHSFKGKLISIQDYYDYLELLREYPDLEIHYLPYKAYIE